MHNDQDKLALMTLIHSMFFKNVLRSRFESHLCEAGLTQVKPKTHVLDICG